MDNENEKVYEEPSVYDPCAPAQKKQKKSNSALRAVALVLVCVLLGGAAGIGGSVYMHNYYAKEGVPSDETQRVAAMVETNRETAIAETVKVDTGELLTGAQVFAANVNSTVGITTSITTNFWGYSTTSAASGSGIVLTDNGYILTNYHVIEDSQSVTVSTYDGASYDASVVGFDQSNDIAVLKVDAEGLSPAVLGKSGDLSVGDQVVAVGNPLGELTFTMTQGIVSALDRDVTLSSGSSMKLIQTDCAINSGNSGGALFNMYGEVVGITNAKFSSSSSGASIDNIGFAIPIDSVRGIIESIIEKGYVSKPYIGVTIAPVSEESKSYGLPAGVAVQSVVDGSPAAEAGLQVYDIITAVNGTPVTANSDLTEAVGSSLPGDVLEFEVYRQGETLKISVTVGEKIQTPESVAAEKETVQNGQRNNGSNPFGDIFGSFGSFFG